ncbi:MAG: hypothetical protein ABJB02_00675 [Dokdonella sp.]
MNINPNALAGLVLGILVTLVANAPASAAIGTLDRVPAATLLLPYFEVDLADPNGPQTRFTVANASPDPTLAHATLWSDTGVPTFSFDLYVGGRGSVEVDLRLLFSGVVPQTAPGNFSAGPDSSPHVAVANCPLAATALYAGMPVLDRLSDSQVAHLRAAHTGQASALFGNMCAGASHGDAIARGYVTIDAVNSCSSNFPTDPNYFVSGGSGIASNANVLFGQYTAIERGNRVTAASPLVSIEASSTDLLTNTAGNYTFYAGYDGANAADNREPLGTVWEARYLDVGFFDPGTELIVWRDPGFAHSPFTCGSLPADFPRQQTEIAAFDEQEQVSFLNGGNVYPNPPPLPIYPFPLIAQRVAVEDLSPFRGGFVHLNLNASPPGSVASTSGLLQSFVAVRHRLGGTFGAALPASYLLGPQHQPSGPGSCPQYPDPLYTYCDSRPARVGY